MSTAGVVFVVADVEALHLLELVRLMKLPVLDLAAVKEDLLDVAPEAVVEGHDAVGVRSHVGDVCSAGVLPGGLPGQD